MPAGMGVDPSQGVARYRFFRPLSKREREFIAKRVRGGRCLPARLSRVKMRRRHVLRTSRGRGEVKVDGKRRRVLEAGHFFGEISMLDRVLRQPPSPRWRPLAFS